MMAYLRVAILLYLCSLSTASSMKTIKLSSGYEMPTLAHCSWLIEAEDVEQAVTTALNSGYRHIDTHYFLGDEKYIGQAIKKYLQNGGKREDLYITTKTALFGNRASDVKKYLKLSMENLGVDYLDMYSIMEPWGLMKDPSREPAHDAIVVLDNGTIALDFETDYVATWKELEAQVKAGLVRSIGLHDFNEEQVLKIINNCEIKPSYLSVEGHLYNQQNQLNKLCIKHNIVMGVLGFHGVTPAWEMYLTKKYLALPPIQKNPVVTRIASDHGMTPIQVLMRHQLQKGHVLIMIGVKQPELIKDSLAIYDFELTEDELKLLDNLDKREDGRLISDFNFPGIAEHPEYPHPR